MDETTQPGPAKPLPPLTHSTPAPAGPGKREPRKLAAGQGAAWWSEGWQVFMAAPGTWIGMIVVLLLIMMAMSFIPILGTLATSVLSPVFGGGIVLGCHALAKGRPFTVGVLFDGFSSGRFMPLFIVGLLYLAAMFVLWIVVIVVILGVAGGAGIFSAMSTEPSQLGMALLGSIGITGLILAPFVLVAGTAIMMAYWFAPQLVVLNGEEPIAAMQKSFRASWQNLGAMAVYGLIFIGLAIVASIPLGLGWFVLGPVVAGSWYASWREMFDA
ncbi:MAG TPA: BPSS1780 family membrane protein [Casimicrobiaceae bacterium]|jgi:uncharacterized membrane protein